MKKLLTLLIFISVCKISLHAQNKPVFEEILASPSCPTVKSYDVTKALASAVAHDSAILIIANCRNSATMNMSDYNNRYRTFNKWYAGSSESIRYNGKYDSHGSIFADKHNGVYNVLLGTIDKFKAMLATCASSGWNLNATYNLSGATVTVTAKINSNAATNCNLVAVLYDASGNFKQCLSSYDGIPIVVTPNTGTVTISGNTPYTNFKVAVFCQNPLPFSVDSWGTYEREIYAANTAVKQ